MAILLVLVIEPAGSPQVRGTSAPYVFAPAEITEMEWRQNYCASDVTGNLGVHLQRECIAELMGKDQ